MGSDHLAYVAVGSNVGRRAENCRHAIAAVAATKGCALDGQSALYETEPVGREDQRWFVNAVIRIRTCLTPDGLLHGLKGIERAMGRGPEAPRWGPRSIDLDILFYDDLVLSTAELEIPHPRVQERRFVLQPLCDVAPQLVHPVMKETVRSLLDRLGDKKKVLLLP